MRDKKEYVIKIKNSQAYLQNIDRRDNSYTFDLRSAKKYTIGECNKICKDNKEFETVKYASELYKIKNERFKIFVKTLINQENSEILENDIKIFTKALKNEDMLTGFCDLKEKYPQNNLINEIERILQKIEFKNIYKGNPEKSKIYKEFCEEYDYDEERQFDILKLAFDEKYINKELLEENEIIEQ